MIQENRLPKADLRLRVALSVHQYAAQRLTRGRVPGIPLDQIFQRRDGFSVVTLVSLDKSEVITRGQLLWLQPDADT